MDTLTRKLFAAMFTDQDGEQANAARMLVNHVTRKGIHPAAIRIEHDDGGLVARQHAAIERLMEKIKEKDAEIRSLREQLPKKAVRQAQKAGKLQTRWPELEELIRARFGGGDLPRGWQAMVIETCGVPRHVFVRWRDGVTRIPDAAFDRVRTMETAVRPRRRRAA